MTQEDKELLLKDLSARLSYGVKINDGQGIIEVKGIVGDRCYFNNNPRYDGDCLIENARPYLRPMSSMTEAELKEYISITENVLVAGEKSYTVILSNDATDWLNAHHFDYRGLIEKGLALKAVDGIY